MADLSRSARLYQERRLPGDRTTRRLPALRTNLGLHPVHRATQSPPYPSPESISTPQPPDATATHVWPYQTIEEIVGGSETT